MKILMVNKFLFPNGGSETYIFKLGDYLKSLGHEVQYFGMEHEGRCVSNECDAYTSDMDFHGGRMINKLLYPIKTIYSVEARRKIRCVLDAFQPDVVHLNNFNYQLTPSVILETVTWREESARKCRIVATAHDAQLVCPSHRLYNPNTHELCEKCLSGHFINCFTGRCIHGSMAKSIIGSAEAYYWNARNVYRYLDAIICPSAFIKTELDSNPVLAGKTVEIRNFIDKAGSETADKKDYVLYFGAYSQEKGLRTLAAAVRACADIPFVFAGSGPLEELVNTLPNVRNVGFQTGLALDTLIREAQFSVCPSEVHDNCPFSVMESQERGTPVVGTRVGGIPELIEDGVNGRLFERRDEKTLAKIIRELWSDRAEIERYSKACGMLNRDGLPEYCEKIMKIYRGE